MTIKILIGADICPTHTNFKLFSQANRDALLGKELADLLQTADYTIFNLETPLTDKEAPIAKQGPCLYAPTATIKGIKIINPHFFTLANNHILDQGIQGLQSTISLLKREGISYAGVGDNLSQAAKPYIANIKGIKLGIYCCAEHEFSIATDTTPGANPYDPLVSFDVVRALKKQCDYVIVLYHGGKEHYRYPSPQLQRVFRKFAECGANLVIAQHTHCIGCMEEYEGSSLIYGQGNFLFDGSDSEYWKDNLLIELHIDEKTKTTFIDYIPCIQKESGVRLASSGCSKEILTGFQNRSQQITSQSFIKQNYLNFSRNLYSNYLQKANGRFANILVVRILKKLIGPRNFIKLYYSKKNLLEIRNLIECECWYESFLTLLKHETTRNK